MSVPLRAPAACTAAPLPPRRRVRTHAMRPGLGLLDEPTLIARSIDGDGDAFSELVRRHHSNSYGLALRLTGSAADADDVAQEAFLAAWRRIGTFRGDASFGSWMYRIVVNRCSNLTRARKPAVDVDALHTTPRAPTSDSPEQRAEQSATFAALAAALQTLTVQQRACWVLRELHYLSYPEIADVLGVTPTVVRGRLARARAELSEAMKAWL